MLFRSYVIRFLEDILDALNRSGVSENQEAFQRIKTAYDASTAAHKAGIAKIKTRLENLFQFVEEAFADGQEMLILVTELTVSSAGAAFIASFGSPEYQRFSQEMMLSERQSRIQGQIADLNL